jgi:hypothetical protein
MKIVISLFALIVTNSHISLTPPPPPPMPMPTAKVAPVAAKALPAPAPMPAVPAAVPAAVAPVAAAPVVAAAVKPPKPTTVSFRAPFKVQVLHTGGTKISISAYSLVYYFFGSKTQYTYSHKLKKPTPENKGISFGLPKAVVPLPAGETGSPDTGIGISSLTINGDIVDVSPAWSSLETDTIYVKTNKQGKIVVDKAAMKKAANNGGTLPAEDATVPAVTTPKTVPTKTTAPSTPAQTPQNPTPATKAVATTIVNTPPATTPVTKKSKSGKSTKKALATKATTVA